MCLADVSGIRERHLGAALDAFCFPYHSMNLNIAQHEEMSNPISNKLFDICGGMMYIGAMKTLRRIGEWLFAVFIVLPVGFILLSLWQHEEKKKNKYD